MKRNKGIDIFRVAALMAVLIYHFYVLTGESRFEQYPILDRLIGVGGEIGVTLFFIISGFGIYTLLDYKDSNGAIKSGEFLKKRLIRMLPQYYFSLIFILLITVQAAQIGPDGIFGITTHALLIHNFFPSTCGSISTVLWTMGVIFQFYLIAIPLFRCMKKRKILTFGVIILFTITCKWFIYHLAFNYIEIEASYYFIYGRQLFTALDNFAGGMFLSAVMKNISKVTLKKVMATIIGCCGILGWVLLLGKYNLYADTWMGYSWHSILSLLLMFVMYNVCSIDFEKETILLRIISFVSKYQYGIYLWHFVVASNLLQNSFYIQMISQRSFLLLVFVLSVICIIAGWLSSITVDSVDYNKIFQIKNKKEITAKSRMR